MKDEEDIVCDKTKIFVIKATEIHKGKYIYDRCTYTRTYDKLMVICPIHGEFEIVAKRHLSGVGCPHSECRSAKFKQTMNERYGVDHPSQSPVLREVWKQKIVEKYGVENPIQSPELFKKRESTYIEVYGTKNPASNPLVKLKKAATCEDKYGNGNVLQSSYSLDRTREKYGAYFVLQSNKGKEKVKATTLERYGVENVSLHSLTNKRRIQTFVDRYGVTNPSLVDGCNEKREATSVRLYGVRHFSQQHMVDVVGKVESKNWLYQNYISSNKTSVVMAKELGISPKTVLTNLHKVNIEIRQDRYSRAAVFWMDSIMEEQNVRIQHILTGGEFSIPETRYKVDGYCKETNTVYEFYGDYWHGNPKKYASDIINDVNGCTMGELYQRTLDREQVIRDLGYNLVVIWESDFLADLEMLLTS